MIDLNFFFSTTRQYMCEKFRGYTATNLALSNQVDQHESAIDSKRKFSMKQKDFTVRSFDVIEY